MTHKKCPKCKHPLKEHYNKTWDIYTCAHKVKAEGLGRHTDSGGYCECDYMMWQRLKNNLPLNHFGYANNEKAVEFVKRINNME